MKLNLILVIFLLPFLGCSDDLITSGNTIVFDEYDALIESVWTLQKVTKKYGTHNPDEIVPASQMEEIIFGDELTGEINFNSNNIITISNASNEFYFNRLNSMQWNYEDKFIWFKHNFGAFGYKVIWYGPKQMKWYIEGIGIEDGSISVEVIEMLAVN